MYVSSVLTSVVDSEHCPACRFVSGDRSIGTMLTVIDTLDQQLAASEQNVRRLVELVHSMALQQEKRRNDGETQAIRN